MADSKKYNGSTWEHSLRKLTTATEAIENPLYSDGTAITSYTIKGNTVQNGTPTPSNPVDVNGVGVRTENLFDVLDYTDIQTSINGGASNVVKTSSTISFKSNGENAYSGIYIPTTYFTAHINDYDVSTTYTLSADVYTDVPCTIIFGGSATIVSIPAGTSRLSYRFYGNISLAFYIRNTTANITLSKIMFAINDTTYEPYGYKIPISNGQQTIDIYIGDLPLLKSLDGTAFDEISNGTLTRRVDSDGSVLPTPTTTQITTPSIPTIEGANSIIVDTTVQPSEFTATWTGWHDSSVKEWDGSQWG